MATDRAAERERTNRLMLRARDAMDRAYAEPLDTGALATLACCSPAHFIRTFAATFGETPHRYLQRRRVERAMALLRTTDLDVQDVCVAVGWSSLATFTRTFGRIVGVTPAGYRATRLPATAVPTCFEKAWTRPRTTAPEARRTTAPEARRTTAPEARRTTAPEVWRTAGAHSRR